MASIHVNGIDLYYEVHGSGMPLVMLHGNGEDHTTFSTLCAALQDRFQIFLFDTRGHGKSTPVSEYHYSDMAQDMTEALIQLFDGPIDLLGFSDGGIIALFLAIWYPQLVRRMILCGANYHPYGIKEEGRRDMRAEYARSGDPHMALMLEEPLLTKADLSRVQCPTCVLAGQNDIIEEAHTREIAACIADSRLFILEHEDHASYVEGSDMSSWARAMNSSGRDDEGRSEPLPAGRKSANTACGNNYDEALCGWLRGHERHPRLSRSERGSADPARAL